MSNYDKDKINKAIDGMTAICDKGKQEVRAVLSALIGEELAPWQPVPLVLGGVYRNGFKDERTLISLGENRYVLVSIMKDMLGQAVTDDDLVWPLVEDDLMRYMAKHSYTYVAERTIS